MYGPELLGWIREVPFWEWILFVFYMLVILVTGYIHQQRKKRLEPIYRYYFTGLVAKVFSVLIFTLIYLYYYHGGDTVSYYETSRSMMNLAFERPGDFVHVMFEGPSFENYYRFDYVTGYPWPYMFFDAKTLFVAKLLTPILMVSFKSYVVANLVLAWISYTGVWRLYKMVSSYYPQLQRQLMFAILLVPSALFWGSGILKDTFTLAASCWFIYSFNLAFIRKQERQKNIILALVSGYVLLMVKPYILIALLPGAVVWLLYSRIVSIRSRFWKAASIPMIYIGAFLVGYVVLSLAGDSLGKFAVSRALETAAATQYDLKQDYYGSNFVDIGTYAPTIGGVLSKVPIAIRVGLFQPFLWQANNIVMLFSGLENMIYLVLSLVLLFRFIIAPARCLRVLLDNPLLLFFLSYTLIFAAMVGLTTANFGALVRFKIPFLPALLALLFIWNYLLLSEKQRSRYFRRAKIISA